MAVSPPPGRTDLFTRSSFWSILLEQHTQNLIAFLRKIQWIRVEHQDVSQYTHWDQECYKKAQQWEGSRLDNIPPEAIKAAGEVSEEVLLDFYNRMLDEERVPEMREKGLLIKLPKYGDVSNCRNCCGIILLNKCSVHTEESRKKFGQDSPWTKLTGKA